MEFSRRGPATDGTADCHRCPDPPPHGDAMLVMRDALLWQLHKDRLRQEIIMAELAKIERAMALRAVSGHHSTPMPWDSTPQHKGPGFGWEHYFDVGEENDVKLPNSDKRHWNPDAEDRVEKCWNPCKCRLNSGEHNSEFDKQKLQDSSENVLPNKVSPAVKWELTGITIPVKKLKPPMSPRKKKPPMRWSCAVCQVQLNSEQDIQMHYGGKKHQSNMATLESNIKAIGGQKTKKAAEPSLCTDQIKTSMVRWSCSTCQANGTCQSDLEEHLKGTRHQQNIIALCKEGSNKNLVENIAPHEAKSHESDVPQHPEKPPLAGCSICQVICGRESDLEIHLKGKRHSKNIIALCKEGSNNNIVENIAPHEAKSHEDNMPQHAEKLALAGCSICQVICGRESDLEIHLKGKRHLKKIQALFEESNNKAINSESQKANLNLDSEPLHAEKMNCELDWESHLKDKRRQLNVQTVCKIINQEENTPPEFVKVQTSYSEWDCIMCQAKCYSKAHFENHCTGRKHQQRTHAILSEGGTKKTAKTHVILSEGDITKTGNLHMEASCKEGSKNNMAKNVAPQEEKSHERNVQEHESPSVQSCTICQGICNCESDLDIHLMSERIRAVVEKCKNMAMNSESQKAKLNPDGIPQHVEEISCKSNWESYPRFTDETLQPMGDWALHEEINQDKVNPAEIAKDQTPSSEWDCAICQAKCNSKAQYEHHCISRKHQRRTQVMLGKGDSTKTGSLETADELPSDGSNSKNELPPEKVEEQKALNL